MRLVSDPPGLSIKGAGHTRQRLGLNARRYAEATFDIVKIADHFIDVFAKLWHRSPRRQACEPVHRPWEPYS